METRQDCNAKRWVTLGKLEGAEGGVLKLRELKPYGINAGRTNTGSDWRSKRNTVDLKN